MFYTSQVSLPLPSTPCPQIIYLLVTSPSNLDSATSNCTLPFTLHNILIHQGLNNLFLIKIYHVKALNIIREKLWRECVLMFDNIIEETIIPKEQKKDELCWSQSDSGQLSLRQAYAHVIPPKLVWNISSIPPSCIMIFPLMST